MVRRRLLFIALDGFRLDIFKEMLEEGQLPNIESLVDRGVWLELLPTYPAITPASWTSMITGAWPGTHGLINFQLHFTGEPLDVLHNAFQPEYVNAETLWEVAERNGRRVVLVHFPGTRGAKKVVVNKGIVVGGRVLGYYTVGEFGAFELAPSRIYTTREVRETRQGRIVRIPRPAPSERGLETVMRIEVLDEILEYKVVAMVGGEGERRVLILDASDVKLAELSVGDWSNWIEVTIGGREAVLRFKLLELSPDCKTVSILQSGICPKRDYTIPEDMSSEITEKVGPFLERIELPLAPFREWPEVASALRDAFFELSVYQADWLARVAAYVVGRKGYDVLFTEFHEIDHMHHYAGGLLSIRDPAYRYLNKKNPCYDEAREEEAVKAIKDMCIVGDELVGKLLKIADEDTVVVVASDHGIVPAHTQINVNAALMEAGLLAVKREGGQWVIDWSRTKAYHWERNFISVNLKGREPVGAVDPEDYWDVREEVIHVLNSLEDPVTGEKNLFTLFRKEECLPLGLYGERLGDIFLLLKPGYTTWPRLVPEPGERVFQIAPCGAHTFFHPMILENKGIFVIAGPGVADSTSERVIRAIDVAPTLSYLLEIPIPAQNQGKILRGILSEA